MCGREGTSLQRGMSSGLRGDHSVVVLSKRVGAPYHDQLEDEGLPSSMKVTTHFDHDLPYSKGGTSITEDNVQLMCARHNFEKGAKII